MLTEKFDLFQNVFVSSKQIYHSQGLLGGWYANE